MQKAIFITEVGKPVSLGSRPIPTPGPDEVLIKVTAAQLLPHDTYGRDIGLFFGKNLPFIPGTNIAGTVTKLGPSVTKYPLGALIFGQGNPLLPTPDQTGLQQYAILNINYSAPVPKGFTDDQVVTLPVNATTSFAALFLPQFFGFPAPYAPEAKTFNYAAQKLVIIGAGSNVGKLAIQFAKTVGIGQIIAVASLSGESVLRELGATHVVDRHSSTIVQDIRAACGGPESVTQIYDCVNWTHELAVEAISSKVKSKILALHPADSAVALVEKEGKGNVEVKFVSGLNDTVKGVAGEYWDLLGKWVQEGRVRIPKYRTIEGLDVVRVDECLDSYRDGSPVTQAVVHPNGKVGE